MATAQDLLPIIRQVIREEITPRLDPLEQKINEIALLRKSVQTMKNVWMIMRDQ